MSPGQNQQQTDDLSLYFCRATELLSLPGALLSFIRSGKTVIAAGAGFQPSQVIILAFFKPQTHWDNL